MKNILLVIFLIVPLTACTGSVSETETTVEQRQGESTLTGKLIATDASHGVLQADTGETVGLESYSVDFTAYDGQEVTVSGEFSGPTLFVDIIK